MKLAAVAVLALLAAPVFAQAPPTPGMHRGPGGPGFGHEGLHTAVAPITSAPLTAKYTSTSTFTTRDGKSVERDGSAVIYRDALGRTREDITMPPPPPHTPRPASDATATTTAPKPPAGPRTMTVILDPVANTVTRLMADRKIAIVEAVPADFFKHAIDREAREATGPQHPHDNATVTPLGAKTFAGVSATGTRITRTFTPHDAEASATPKTETHDAWFSPDLKIEVSSSETGGHGTSVNTLTTLTRAEPDATLFKVPEGYTVTTATPHDHHGRGPGGPPSDAPAPGL